MDAKNEALEIWKFQLSSGQKDALRLAYQGQNIRRGVSNIYGELHWKSYDKITRMKLLSGGRITDKGRAVYEAGNPKQAAIEAEYENDSPSAIDGMFPKPESGHTFVRGLWRVTEKPLGDTTMEVYELISTDPDELTSLRAQLEQARKREQDLRAALEPFAKTWREWPDDMRWVDWLTTNGNGGASDFKRADEALAQIARKALEGGDTNGVRKEDSR